MQDSKRDTDMKNKLLDSMGEDEGGMICENSIEPCISPYVKQITSPSLMHETGLSKSVHWDTLRDRMGKEVGRAFRMGDIYIPMADSCQRMAQTTTIL